MTPIQTELTIPPATVQMNPSYESDWVRALYRFVTDACKTGQTVRLTLEQRTFTPSEAGQLLGVSRSTVQREIASGRIKAVKHGSRYRIPESEIARLRRTIQDDIAEMFANDF
ncbi:MAG: helix-turn-helix domain-containing protein [Propionibacteriaceae bacterium]|nr:helix-turn-helix domain-containing protein [Propionibacteriaceae bacterium]